MHRSSALVAALALTACTGGQAGPRRPTPVARPMSAPSPYSRPASPAPAPSSALHGGGPLHWHTRLADAQAEARAQGRLLLVGTTKVECSMCDKFAHEIAPACSGRLRQVAVAYMYDITRPEDARLDGALRANLPGAILMPLVGFLTPELRWVHGFSGPRTAQEFMGDIETAARLHPLRAAAARAVSGPALTKVSFVNEFGETEWSQPADAWPKPEDALGPAPALAVAPAPQPSPAINDAPAVAFAEPTPSPVAAPAVLPVASAPADGAVLDATAGWSAPPSPSAIAAAVPEPLPLPVYEPQPTPPAADLPPLNAPAPRAIAAVPMDESQARAALGRAFDLIRDGRYDDARDELRRVSRSLPQTPIGREADRGGVAVYNARRISEADAQERADLQANARRSLDGTMWVTLF